MAKELTPFDLMEMYHKAKRAPAGLDKGLYRVRENKVKLIAEFNEAFRAYVEQIIVDNLS